MARYDFATHRLFLESDLSTGHLIPLDGQRTNYLLNVLRMPEGGRLLVFNGREGEWEAQLTSANRKGARITVGRQVRPQPPPSGIRYAFAPLKSARLDYMAQKAVEMGAGTLEPVITRRTQVTRIGLERLRANAIEAAEQCGVLAVPEVRPELPLEKWLALLPAETAVLFFDEDADLADPVLVLRAAKPATVAVLIGPEGGFEDTERRAILARASTIRLSLGPRILRADTAAVAALAAVQFALGDRQTKS